MEKGIKKYLPSLPFLACISDFPENHGTSRRSATVSLERVHELFTEHWLSNLKNRREKRQELAEEAVCCRSEMLSQRKLLAAVDFPQQLKNSPAKAKATHTSSGVTKEVRASKKYTSSNVEFPLVTDGKEKPVKSKQLRKNSVTEFEKPIETKKSKHRKSRNKFLDKSSGSMEIESWDNSTSDSIIESSSRLHESISLRENDIRSSDSKSVGWDDNSTGFRESSKSLDHTDTSMFMELDSNSDPQFRPKYQAKSSWFAPDDPEASWGNLDDGWGETNGSWSSTDDTKHYKNEWAESINLDNFNRPSQQEDYDKPKNTQVSRSSNHHRRYDSYHPDSRSDSYRSKREHYDNRDTGPRSKHLEKSSYVYNQNFEDRTHLSDHGAHFHLGNANDFNMQGSSRKRKASDRQRESRENELPTKKLNASDSHNPLASLTTDKNDLYINWLKSLSFFQTNSSCAEALVKVIPHYHNKLIDFSQVLQLVFSASEKFPIQENQPLPEQLMFLSNLEKQTPFAKAVGSSIYKLVTGKNLSLDFASQILKEASILEHKNEK
ncbi:RNA-induced transcriptional silencing complex protein tas3 [Schizosaccharomyces pombe]